MNSYVMYHCHSWYSIADSTTDYHDYIELAKRDGMKALSFSEHGKPFQWTEKLMACKEAGIKYMHSVEIYLTEQLEPKERDNFHTVLIAKNMEGLRELNTLISLSCDEAHSYYKNRLTFDEFLGMSDNIISTSACLASPLWQLPMDHPRYEELVKKYTFLEVQPHNHPDQIAFNKRLKELSIKYNKPLIAGTDTHSSSPYKAECRTVWVGSKGMSYGDEDAFDLSYKTYDELVDMFKKQNALSEEDYLQAIENTNLLDEMTDEIDLDTSIKYPILYGSAKVDEKKFIQVLQNKFKEKLDVGIIPKDQEQAFRDGLNEEIRVFRKLGMCGFMLSMSELVGWCKENGMSIGPARGSVGGSRAAYVSDITDLNPETWHTIFSRFCNEDRKEVGDIDIDCVTKDRPRIFEYIVQRFGRDRTARVASFGTAKGKDTIDIIGRYYTRKWEERGKVGPNKFNLEAMKEIKQLYDTNEAEARRKYPEVFYYFDGIINTKTSEAVHPAGMVISPISLNDNYGVYQKDDDMCMFLDMDCVHDIGLVKYDFLGLKTIKVIEDICNYTGLSYPRMHEIDWEDQDVWNEICDDGTTIFQAESQFFQNCTKKFRPRNLFEMSLVTACIRPSGASYRDELLARKPHKNPSPMIDELLKDNLGYLVYQEDTIKFLQQICGLSGSEADTVRRGIGRKKKEVLDAALPKILEGYCNNSDQPKEKAEEEAKEFLRIIEDSADYQFGLMISPFFVNPITQGCGESC